MTLLFINIYNCVVLCVTLTKHTVQQPTVYLSIRHNFTVQLI
jgi:hypothetical protein